MTDSLVVLVFLVASGSRMDPTTSSLTNAARQALGADTALLFDERTELPSEAEALALGARVRAGAVVELEWVDPMRTSVLVHVHESGRPGWANRNIVFAPNDAPTECGRTLGFAIASMISRRSEEASAPPMPSKAPELATPAGSERGDTSQARTGGPATPPVALRAAVDVTAVVTAGSASGSDSLGGATFGNVWLLPMLAAHVGARLGFGSINGAGATFSSLELGGGLAWRTLATAGPRRFELSLRGDVFATELVVHRATDSRSRWLPAASLGLEGVWFVFAPTIGLLGTVGVEGDLGTTSIAVGNDTVAKIPPFHAMSTLGVRVGF